MIRKKLNLSIQTTLAISALAIGLTGCNPEQQYRGVSGPKWQQLSAEQKQLIVDQAYQSEIVQTQT